MNNFCFKYSGLGLVLGLALGLSATSALAHPVNPIPYTIDNQGDSLTIRKIGDEHYKATVTEDGFLVAKGTDGIFYYVDESGAASGIKAKNAKGRDAREQRFLKGLNRNSVGKAHREKNPDRFKLPKEKNVERRAPWVPSAESSGSETPTVLRQPPAPFKHSSGTNRFPVVMVAGTGSANYDSLSFYNLLNQTGYSENRSSGSVRDYFEAQSNGLFVPQYDLYFVTVSKALADYAGNEAVLIKEALAALRSKYADFNSAQYDKDNDRYVDVVGIIYAGNENDANDLGGYQYYLQYELSRKESLPEAGGSRYFNSYFIISQLDNYDRISTSVFVHEFSHSMGLKDHYSVKYRPESTSGVQYPGVHIWDVMATGMYNNNNRTPAGYSAFERCFMGWMKYSSLPESDVVVIPPLNTDFTAYKIPVPGNEDEWFILENRQQTNWDYGLPYHGLLIWHIDYDENAWIGDVMNDDPSHQRIDVVEAGSKIATTYAAGFNPSYLYDDPFPGYDRVSEFFGFKSWNGTDLGLGLYNISEEQSNICFATRDGVDVGSCVIESSSSSAGEISSSSEESSSSEAASVSSAAGSSSGVADVSSSSEGTSSGAEGAESSSSGEAPAGSSSSTQALRVTALEADVRMHIRGGVLQMDFATTVEKTVKLFDVQGRLLYRQFVAGSSAAVDLKGLGCGNVIVQVTADGKLLALQRIAVK